ncbi:MAG: OpgC domain-containing protein [Pseudolabrys sp.]
MPQSPATRLWPKGWTKEKPLMPPVSTERDLRLDLFRGIALWLIFLDHIPSNAVSWITIRNYGFSDATEIFVFISGYTAAFVYGRAMRDQGFLVSSARVLKRAWQIYVAHVFLFAIYLAEIAYVAQSFENPLYTEEMGVLNFLKNPDVTILQALLLKFKPVNMDVLPLYIMLLLGFAPVLWLLLRAPSLGLVASVVLYALMWIFDWNIPAYPNGVWVFNPFAWQLLFVFGAWCALGGAQRLSRWITSPVTLSLALAYLVFGFSIAMTWYFPRLAVYVPHALGEAIYPIDKTNLDVLRILHFLSLAVITVWLVPRDWPALKSPVFWPSIICGQHSLETFCLGVFLSFAAHFVFTEVTNRVVMQIAVSLLGIAIMVGAAWLISWYRSMERRGSGPRPPAAKPGLAGGAT